MRERWKEYAIDALHATHAYACTLLNMARHATTRHATAGKHMVNLDLKSADGQDAAWDLLKKADVLIENFKPGTRLARCILL